MRPAVTCRWGGAIAPAAALADAGVAVGLGTSGGGSNDAGHLLADARLALQVAPLVGRPVTAREVLGWATAGSAAGLGRPELGVLTPGAAADLVCWDVTGVADAGGADPLGGLLWRSPGRRAAARRRGGSGGGARRRAGGPPRARGRRCGSGRSWPPATGELSKRPTRPGSDVSTHRVRARPAGAAAYPRRARPTVARARQVASSSPLTGTAPRSTPRTPGTSSSSSASRTAASMPATAGSGASRIPARNPGGRTSPGNAASSRACAGPEHHRHARDVRDLRPGGDELGDRRPPARVVHDAHLGTRPHLLGQPGGAPVGGWGARRLGHRHQQAGRPGRRGQAGGVEVEHRRGVGAVADRGVVARDAVHRGRARIGERGELALQRDPVAVAAVQPRPHGHPAVAEQQRPVGRRELHARAGVVADEDGVDAVREQVGAAQERRPVQRRRRQVGEHERPGGRPPRRQRAGGASGPARGRVGRARRLVCAGSAGPGRGRSVGRRRGRVGPGPSHRGRVDERARQRGVDLAPALGGHAAARPVDHVLRAGHGSSSRALVAAVTEVLGHLCSITNTAELPGSRAS